MSHNFDMQRKERRPDLRKVYHTRKETHSRRVHNGVEVSQSLSTTIRTKDSINPYTLACCLTASSLRRLGGIGERPIMFEDISIFKGRLGFEELAKQLV